MTLSEMSFEPMPEVTVPRVRPRLAASLAPWTDLFYGGRRGFFFAWGCLFWFFAIWLAIKFCFWFVGAVAIWAIVMVLAVADLFTYRRRLRDAQVAAWAQYIERG
jgi:hypothetical protein